MWYAQTDDSWSDIPKREVSASPQSLQNSICGGFVPFCCLLMRKNSKMLSIATTQLGIKTQ